MSLSGQALSRNSNLEFLQTTATLPA